MPKHMTPKALKAYADQSRTYEMFPPNGRPHIVCPQCGALVPLFEDLNAEVKREIAELRWSDPSRAMEKLGSASECDNGHAKAGILHIRGAHSNCHNCGAPVHSGALLCAQCMSVNLDW